jgi:hypothetical protein
MDLVRLESAGTGFAATVRGRLGEGLPTDHDLLDGQLEVWSTFVSGSTRHVFMREDLQAWAGVLDDLEAGRSVSWLAESGRTAEVRFDASELPDVLVIEVDEPLGARAKAVVAVDVGDGWIDELRGRLSDVLAAFPEETVETTPGVHGWRRDLRA